MAGIYVHIPFCKSRCRYCDFFSTTLFSARWPQYKEALKRELDARAHDFKQIMERHSDQVRTIYLGGGTPSLVSELDIADIITNIRKTFSTNGTFLEEVTMEANPGDLNPEKLRALRAGGVNRLSIGIQSFSDVLLYSIGRRHTAKEAIEAVHMAQEAGFDNISIDLMYGLPGETMEMWMSDVQTACSLNVQHVSAYCLTYEEGTPLYEALRRGEVAELDDDLLNQMQEYANSYFAAHGITRYEVSNYAIPGHESKHNSAYWTKAPYLGLGAGAHSYDGDYLRTYNPDDLDLYLAHAGTCHEEEALTEDDRFNELVMLSLRTTKGLDTSQISDDYLKYFFMSVEPYLVKGWLIMDGPFCRATERGFEMLNTIIGDIMLIGELEDASAPSDNRTN